MDVVAFNSYCKTLPATTKVIQWGDAHVWKVGGKIFAIASHWGPDREDGSLKISFKCSDMSYQMLCDEPGIVPAPYLARAKWVQVQEKDALSEEDLKKFIKAAHEITAAKLTKAKRREIGLES